MTFFDKRSDIGNVFPSFFEKSYWNPSFSCSVKESVNNQVDFIIKKLEQNTDDRKIFLYLNVCAIHYPNYFYLDKEKRGKTFVVCFSDHGTCYGEDGYIFHAVNHPVVNTVPYKHFFIE